MQSHYKKETTARRNIKAKDICTNEQECFVFRKINCYLWSSTRYKMRVITS